MPQAPMQFAVMLSLPYSCAIPPGHPHHPQLDKSSQRVGPLKGRQASKVNDAAPLLRHHPWEHGLEQGEGSRQLYRNLPLPHRKGYGTKSMSWQKTAKSLLQTSSD